MYGAGIGGSGPDDDIGVVLLGAEGPGQGSTSQVQPLVWTAFEERNGEVSPNGRWLAYESDESGQLEIYVRPFPEVERGRTQVSTGGGTQPLWGRSGRELFYRNGAAVMVVPVETDPIFAAGSPEMLLEGQDPPNPPSNGGRAYDVSLDGQRFLMIKADGGSENTPPHFILVQNWFEELKRLVPTN